MRLKLNFELETNKLNIQYRKSIISYIKHSLQEYDSKLYEEVYNANNMKTFTFAPILPKAKFQEDEIILENNTIIIIFSAYDYLYALHLYNAFLAQKQKKFSLNRNSMTLKSIIMLKEKEINTNALNIRTLSPIITRNHNKETQKDMYYAYDIEEFHQYLKINIQEQMKKEGLDTSLLEDFKIEPLNAKKVIIKLYEKKIETSIGEFRLEGKKELLDYLYKAGMGSKKAMGFGLFEII